MREFIKSRRTIKDKPLGNPRRMDMRSNLEIRNLRKVHGIIDKLLNRLRKVDLTVVPICLGLEIVEQKKKKAFDQVEKFNAETSNTIKDNFADLANDTYIQNARRSLLNILQESKFYL